MVGSVRPPAWDRSGVDVLALLVGAVLITIATADALHTLIVTRLTVHEWWPTDLYYRKTWRLFRGAVGRIGSDHRREAWLGLYAPLSLLGLLVAWIATLIVGWGFVWWALRHDIDGIDTLGDGIYFSGVSFFSVGFGDILPVDGVARLLVLVEAFSGLTSIALVIGYLPTLYAAYRERESLLLTLDDLTCERMTPMALVRSLVIDGDLEPLRACFTEWERWTAAVLESHTTYPMMAMFRSQHAGQSWLTALGVVTDAAVALVATVPGEDRREPMRLYRRAARTFTVLGDRLHVPPKEGPTLTPTMYESGYAILSELGVELYPFDEAWERVSRLRATYAPQMEGLIDALVAPRGFWAHPVAELTLPTAAELGE